MLNWEAAAALWLGLVLLPILFFYFLRMRFRRQPVSSVYVWMRLQHAFRGGSRLRRWSILLLLLQISAAAAAVAAIARPSWVTRRPAHAGHVFLLDASASMGATEGGRTRFDRARALLAEEVRKMPPRSTGIVFLCDARATALGKPTRDRRQLLARLNKAGFGAAGFVEADVADGLRAWLTVQGQSWQACLATDGGLDQRGALLAAAFGGALRVRTVGGAERNIGLTGLRLTPEGEAAFHLWNGWPVTRTVRVRVEHDGRPLAGETVHAPPGLSRHSLYLGAGADGPGVYAVAVEQHADALAVDDRAYLAVNPPDTVRILLVGAYDPFLRAAFQRPGLTLVEEPVFPASGLLGGGWDVIVADRVPIPRGVSGNLLCFGQVPPEAPVRLAAESAGPLAGVPSAHPLLRFVDWQSVTVSHGRALSVDAGAQTLAEVGGLPMLAAWERDGARCAAWGTTLFASDLGLNSSFPVFLQNYLQWCLPQVDNAAAYTLTVGVPAELAKPPSWRVKSASVLIERHGPRVRVCALAPGVHRWQHGEARGALVANPPASELEIAPRELNPGQGAVHGGPEYTLTRTRLDIWLLGLCLACLCLEWVMWRGGLRAGRGVKDHLVD